MNTRTYTLHSPIDPGDGEIPVTVTPATGLPFAGTLKPYPPPEGTPPSALEEILDFLPRAVHMFRRNGLDASANETKRILKLITEARTPEPVSIPEGIPLSKSELDFILQCSETLDWLANFHSAQESMADGMDCSESARFHEKMRVHYRILASAAREKEERDS